MENKIIFIFISLTTLYLPCKGQNECSIYNEILNDIQSQVTKNKVITITPKGGHDPENPVFINDTIKSKEFLNFYIVRKKQVFNSATLKYWFSNFLNDTSLNSKIYHNENNDSIINCNFRVKYKFIEFKDNINFDLTDIENKKENGKIVTYIPAKIFFSNILISNNTAVVFAKSKIGTDKGEVVYGYIFKKANCQWQIDKRNIEIR